MLVRIIKNVWTSFSFFLGYLNGTVLFYSWRLIIKTIFWDSPYQAHPSWLLLSRNFCSVLFWKCRGSHKLWKLIHYFIMCCQLYFMRQSCELFWSWWYLPSFCNVVWTTLQNIVLNWLVLEITIDSMLIIRLLGYSLKIVPLF